MKQMCRIVDPNECPICGNRQFIVCESNINLYLTGIDGDVISAKELDYNAIGECCKCHNKFAMYPSVVGFSPYTKERQSRLYPVKETIVIDNPMEVEH